MSEYENLLLTISNDGGSYQQRLKIGEALVRSGDRPVAVAAMRRVVAAAVKAQPQVFTSWERTADGIAAGAEALVDEIKTHVDESVSHQVRHHPESSESVETSGSEFGEHVSALPTRKVDPDVLGVLRISRCLGNQVYLPAEKLDRKLYTKVNEVLGAMGGQWKGGKVQAHVFAEVEPEVFEQCFQELLLTSEYTDPVKDLEFFETSKELAARLVAMSGLEPGMQVRETSAGRGAIALAAAAIVGVANVHCTEIFPPNARALAKLGFTVDLADFLSVQPPELEADRADVVLLNPPFSNYRDVAHIMHACKFVKSTGRVLAISSPTWQLATKNRKADGFRAFLNDVDGQVVDVPPGAFKHAGTMVATRILTIEGSNLPWFRDAPKASEMDQPIETEEEAYADAPTF